MAQKSKEAFSFGSNPLADEHKKEQFLNPEDGRALNLDQSDGTSSMKFAIAGSLYEQAY